MWTYSSWKLSVFKVSCETVHDTVYELFQCHDTVLLLMATDIAYLVKIMNSDGGHEMNELLSSSLSRGGKNKKSDGPNHCYI